MDTNPITLPCSLARAGNKGSVAVRYGAWISKLTMKVEVFILGGHRSDQNR